MPSLNIFIINTICYIVFQIQIQNSNLCICVFVYLYLQEQIVGGMSPNALPQSCYYQY